MEPDRDESAVGVWLAEAKEELGHRFIDWVLDSPVEIPTTRQLQAATELRFLVTNAAAEHPPGVGAGVALYLAQHHVATGTTNANALRLMSGGQLPVLDAAPNDPVLDSLNQIALDSYPLLLLPHNYPAHLLIAGLYSPAGKAFRVAVRGDPDTCPRYVTPRATLLPSIRCGQPGTADRCSFCSSTDS